MILGDRLVVVSPRSKRLISRNLCEILLLTFQRSRSKFKVKTQNRRTENLPLLIPRLFNLATRQQ